MRRCGPAAATSGYVARLRRSATRSAAPSTSVLHGCGWPVRVNGETSVASQHNAISVGRRPIDEQVQAATVCRLYAGSRRVCQPWLRDKVAIWSHCLARHSDPCPLYHLGLASEQIPQKANRQVTVYNIGSNPSNELVPQHFGQTDYMLIHDTWMACCRDVYSRMDTALASHHFPVLADMCISVKKPKVDKQKGSHYVLEALQSPEVSNRFAALFNEAMESRHMLASSADSMYTCMITAFQKAAAACLPTVQRRPRKLWISAGTICLLEARDTARQSGDHVRERKINADVKRSVVQDHTPWLNEKLKDGCWNEVRHLRKGSRKGFGPLRDENGDAIDSVNYADAMAKYFADVQWAVRPVPACQIEIRSSNLHGQTFPCMCSGKLFSTAWSCVQMQTT